MRIWWTRHNSVWTNSGRRRKKLSPVFLNVLDREIDKVGKGRTEKRQFSRERTSGAVHHFLKVGVHKSLNHKE